MAVIQETITKPATTSTVNKIICDECGAHAYTKCTQCGADICREHRITSPEDSGGDYTDFVCLGCFDTMRRYTELVAEAEKKLEDVYDERRKVCVANRKKKNKINEANKTKLRNTN